VQGAAALVASNYNTLRDLGGGLTLADAELNDRAQQNWHPLMCIAHVAGGDWEKRARWASLTLADTTKEEELLIELLADVKAVFSPPSRLTSWAAWRWSRKLWP